MTFNDLSLIEPILQALKTEGYTNPTPIQADSIPLILSRRDLLGCAQTGTGKTAAFAIPILQLLHGENQPSGAKTRPIRALVLTPTRELALQISESFTAYGRHTGLRNTVVFGGVPQRPQEDALRRGTDILVATPGRLLDLIGQGFVGFQDLRFFVLDEADRMLDMGFIHDVKKVIARLPAKRQTLFFSATMPPEIADLANSILNDPMKVAVSPVSSTAESVAQSVYFVEKADKRLLLAHLLQNPEIRSVLVFTRTKHGADRVARDLTRSGFHAASIHGDKAQNARQNALQNFKSGRLRVLVATDIAARGIDVEELSHVVNFDLPNIPETYVHRIGRTGRAGNFGTAISFCQTDEVPYLVDIQKLTGKIVPIVEGHPYAMPTPHIAPPKPKQGGQKLNGPAQQNNAPAPKPNQKPQQPRVENGQQNAQKQGQNRPENNGQKPQQQANNNQERQNQPKRDKQRPDQQQSKKTEPRPLLEKPIEKKRPKKKQAEAAQAEAQPPRKKRGPADPIVLTKKPPSRWDFLNKKIEVNIELDDIPDEAGELDYVPTTKPVQTQANAQKQGAPKQHNPQQQRKNNNGRPQQQNAPAKPSNEAQRPAAQQAQGEGARNRNKKRRRNRSGNRPQQQSPAN